MIEDDKHLNAIRARFPTAGSSILGEAGTILLSADAGKTCHARPLALQGLASSAALVADDGAVVAFGLRGRIFRSTDGGKTWKAVDNASVATLMGGTRLPDGALVIAGNGGTILVSRDNGQSFVPLATGSHEGVRQGHPRPAERGDCSSARPGASEVALPLAKR